MVLTQEQGIRLAESGLSAIPAYQWMLAEP